jgi:hypothetical protein
MFKDGRALLIVFGAAARPGLILDWRRIREIEDENEDENEEGLIRSEVRLVQSLHPDVLVVNTAFGIVRLECEEPSPNFSRGPPGPPALVVFDDFFTVDLYRHLLPANNDVLAHSETAWSRARLC